LRELFSGSILIFTWAHKSETLCFIVRFLRCPFVGVQWLTSFNPFYPGYDSSHRQHWAQKHTPEWCQYLIVTETH